MYSPVCIAQIQILQSEAGRLARKGRPFGSLCWASCFHVYREEDVHRSKSGTRRPRRLPGRIKLSEAGKNQRFKLTKPVASMSIASDSSSSLVVMKQPEKLFE